MSSEGGNDGHFGSFTLRVKWLSPCPGPSSGPPLGKPLFTHWGVRKAKEMCPPWGQPLICRPSLPVENARSCLGFFLGSVFPKMAIPMCTRLGLTKGQRVAEIGADLGLGDWGTLVDAHIDPHVKVRVVCGKKRGVGCRTQAWVLHLYLCPGLCKGRNRPVEEKGSELVGSPHISRLIELILLVRHNVLALW